MARQISTLSDGAEFPTNVWFCWLRLLQQRGAHVAGNFSGAH